MKLPRLYALAILAAAPSARAAPVLLPRVSHTGSYGETYTFIGDLAEGTYVHVTLSVTNIGPGSMKGICRAVVAGGGRPLWSASARVGRSEWGYQAKPEERLTIGPCTATQGDSRAEVQADLEGGTVRLSFAEPLRSRVPPGALVAVGENRYWGEVLLYRAPVEAAITLPGEKARTASGAGYADHSRSSVPPKDLASRWVRFRGLRGERGLLLLGRQSREGQFGPLWACDEPGLWREYASFQLERSGADKAPAFRIQVRGAEGAVEIRSGPLLYRDAPVEDLGLVGKIVAPFVGSPVTYVYRASASQAEAPPIDGILEVELGGE